MGVVCGGLCKNWRIPTTCLFHGIGTNAILECVSSCFSVGGCLSLHFGHPCLCETRTPWDCCLCAVQYLSRPQLPPPSEVEEQVVVPPPPPSIGMPFPMNQVLLPPVCVRMVSVVFLCVMGFCLCVVVFCLFSRCWYLMYRGQDLLMIFVVLFSC